MKPSFNSLFGIPYSHMHLHKLLVWDGFLFECMFLYLCRRLMWKLISLSPQTGAWWVHKGVNECIMHSKNTIFVKPSLNSLFGISYLHELFSQYINLIWLFVWVHVSYILEKAYAKVYYYNRRNRCRMHWCIMLLMNASAM